MSTSKIKWYSSFNTNAPKLDNSWGALVNVLKKCLVEGFGAVQSSSTSFNGDFLTVTFTEDHGFLQHQLVEVSGSGVTSIDGLQRISKVIDNKQIVLKLNGNSISNISTTLSIKLPSLGWELLYDLSNKAVFKSTADNGPNHCLFVQNNLPTGYTTTWAKFANLGMAEEYDYDFEPKGLSHPVTWTDLNPKGTGTSMTLGANKIFYNVNSSYDLGSSIAPSYGSTNGNVDWYLIGDGSYFYLLNGIKVGSTNMIMTGMGQYDCLHAGFNHNTFLCPMSFDTQAANGTSNMSLDFCSLASTTRGLKTLASYADATVKVLNTSSYNGLVNSGSSNILAAAGPTNLFKVYVRDSRNILMGTLKNIYWLAVQQPYNNRQIFKQGDSIYLAITTYLNNTTCQVVFKIGEN